jgi:uncharacterized protein (DUF2147 family)
MKQVFPIAALAALAAAASSASTGQAPIEGRWSNPKDSVVVEVARCGTAYCGTVVQASPKAKADAREGGIANLVGTRLMSGFRPIRSGYRGKVLLPKRGIHATGTIRPVGTQQLSVKGCLVGGMLCKEQRWDRVR